MSAEAENAAEPAPALPWTETYMRWSSLAARGRTLLAWASIPRACDLRALRSYVLGLRIHRALLDEDLTMLFPLRGRTLYRLSRHADRDQLPGALVDCGTYNGGSTALLAAGAPRRNVWAFDSFEGLPAPSVRDTTDGKLDLAAANAFRGLCLGSEERLREAVARYAPSAPLHVRRGWFQDTLPVSRADIGPIAVLHIDGDWYDSVRCVLENLHEQVVPGGAIVIDDYGAVLGAGRATRDFRRTAGDEGPLIRLDQTGVYCRKR